MSKKSFADMTMAERQELASRVKSLRQEAGMTQAELAKAAGVSRATINTLETGAKVPQAENLAKVLTVFGLTDDPSFEPQTELWLTMIGTLIEAIPTDRREPAVASVIRELGRDVNRRDVGAAVDDEDFDIEENPPKKGDLRLAAKRGNRK
ncbi:helix-turn-helix transcriptional regulator [Microbacterium sp. BG28]|jgi:transcriptional regulator with XRE-family HTH domain|uniref:helix-turn-helix transcriptional regulator n=1 Tax=Microbacterium sp. BG28 TaxID=3097356 RepID=UPI002A59D19C|nr:helix-turn-helix transcriptional regulator [Microbacterium sp. BG28]MDY0828548.1 helix-turn-helix transcriptional regulator [Microbacterium sp. BG28]